MPPSAPPHPAPPTPTPTRSAGEQPPVAAGRPCVLVADPDRRQRLALRTALAAQGLDVLEASRDAEVDSLLAHHAVDALVLDTALPEPDGLSMLRSLRARGSDVPIIMLSQRHDDLERVLGLELGADDFVTRPVHPRELLARLRAVLRRRPPPQAPAAPADRPWTVKLGGLTLDLFHRRLSRNGVTLTLTSGEFAMLKALVGHPRQPLTRHRLSRLARGREFRAHDRSIDVQIARLRKLIEPEPARPRYIQTVWGQGYVFVPDEGPDPEPAGPPEGDGREAPAMPAGGA